MKRNLILFAVSFIFWLVLLIFSEPKHVWSILFVASIVVIIGFVIKLHLHLKIKANYHKHYNLDIKEFLAALFYFAPLPMIFVGCTLIYGKSEIAIPNASDFIITISIGAWISWMESVLITNSFVKQTIDNLGR